MKIITQQSIIVLIFLMFIFSSKSTKAQDKPPFTPRFYLNIGAFNPRATTTLQISGDRAGAILGLEENYGFTGKPWVIRGEAIYNFKKRSGVSLSFFNINRQHEKTIERDIQIFDTVFHVGANSKITFNTAIVAATYRFAIFKKPEWDAGLSVGLLFMNVHVEAELKTQQTVYYAQSETFPAPAPTFGIFGSAYLMKNLRGRYDLDFFSVRFSDFNVNTLNNRVALEYYFIKNLGIGSAVTFYVYNIDQFPISSKYDASVKYSLYGFSFFLTSRF